MKVKCIKQPVVEGHYDTQVRVGKIYSVCEVKPSIGEGETFYTIIGDDKVEIERAAKWFVKTTIPRKTSLKKNVFVFNNLIDNYNKGEYYFVASTIKEVLIYTLAFVKQHNKSCKNNSNYTIELGNKPNRVVPIKSGFLNLNR